MVFPTRWERNGVHGPSPRSRDGPLLWQPYLLVVGVRPHGIMPRQLRGKLCRFGRVGYLGGSALRVAAGTSESGFSRSQPRAAAASWTSGRSAPVSVPNRSTHRLAARENRWSPPLAKT